MRGSSVAQMGRGIVAIAAGLLALTVQVAPAYGAPTQGAQATGVPVASGNVASPPIPGAAALAAGAGWTPARMAAAKPVDIGVPSGRDATDVTTAVPGGPAVTVAPTAGTLPALSSPLSATGVPRPYTNLPDRLNGKVFFSDGISDYVCSGTVVNSNNKDMVDTAGHCVSNGAGTFYQEWAFVPAYSSSATACATAEACFPFGVWTAGMLTTRSDWFYSGNLKQDYGYAVLDTLDGQHIADYLGGQGSAFNEARSQTWTDFGYPQAAPFTGFDQDQCVSGRISDDDPVVGPGSPTIAINCNLTGGASGGGWLIDLAQATGLGYVNSHNSYRYVDGPLANPNTMYGPYFGDEAFSLFDFTQGLPPGTFASLSPTRLLDTRYGIGTAGGAAGAVAAMGSIPVQVAGRAGVPAAVAAVVVNVTVTSPTQGGYITAYADGAGRPTASNLNFSAGQTVPNLVVVPVGANGRIRLFNGSPGTVHLIADIAGYYLAGTPQVAGAFASLSPTRLLDTRYGIGTAGGAAGAVAAMGSIQVQVAGRAGVPAAVAAVVVNVTVTSPTQGGYITAYADGAGRPTASNLNFSAGQTVPNLVVVPVGANGRIRLFNGSPGTVHLIADIAGYYLAGTPQVAGCVRVVVADPVVGHQVWDWYCCGCGGCHGVDSGAGRRAGGGAGRGRGGGGECDGDVADAGRVHHGVRRWCRAGRRRRI